MTLDQIMFRLCDKDLLKYPVGKRQIKVSSEGAVGVAATDKQGRIKAVSRDGKEIYLKKSKKTKVQMIREQQKRQRKKERSRKMKNKRK